MRFKYFFILLLFVLWLISLWSVFWFGWFRGSIYSESSAISSEYFNISATIDFLEDVKKTNRPNDFISFTENRIDLLKMRQDIQNESNKYSPIKMLLIPLLNASTVYHLAAISNTSSNDTPPADKLKEKLKILQQKESNPK